MQYRGFDIANHFREWAGFETEWGELPSLVTQRLFLESYLDGLCSEHSYDLQGEEISRGGGGGGGGGGILAEGACAEMGSEARRGARDDMIAEILEQVRLFSIASDSYWGLWALIQQRYSTISFEYLAYAMRRFARFSEEYVATMQRARRFFAAADSLPSPSGGSDEL